MKKDNVIDFSDSSLSGVRYGGSERKIGIRYCGDNYMLKFQKNTRFGKRYNHISEYLGSHIFNMLGINCQETILGIYKGEQVVACKDFGDEDAVFKPFNSVGESTLETDIEKYQYSYDDILLLLKKNIKLTKVEECINNFFDIYIVDALLGNFDRHGANWGFLQNSISYKLAPVFDNGSCLYPSMIDENEMKFIIDNEEETNRRIFDFPTSQIKLHNAKSSYFEVINSLDFEECNNALKRIFPRINLDAIFLLIDQTPFISELHKNFYKHMIKNRYEKILKASYEKLVQDYETI